MKNKLCGIFQASCRASLQRGAVGLVTVTVSGLRDRMRIRVLLIRPGHAPEVAVIENDLASFRAAVGGGYIECVQLTDTVCLWCDEEGKLKGLQASRYVPELNDVVAGQFFLTGPSDDEGEALPLSDFDLRYYTEHFFTPLRRGRDH